MCYELWNEDGELVGVYKDSAQAELAHWRHPECEMTATWPTMDSANCGGRCVKMTLETMAS